MPEDEVPKPTTEEIADCLGARINGVRWWKRDPGELTFDYPERFISSTQFDTAVHAVWDAAIGIARVDEGVWDDAAKHCTEKEFQTFHRALRDVARSIITALEHARDTDLSAGKE